MHAATPSAVTTKSGCIFSPHTPHTHCWDAATRRLSSALRICTQPALNCCPKLALPDRGLRRVLKYCMVAWVIAGVAAVVAIGAIVLAVVLTRKPKADNPTKWVTCKGVIRGWNQGDNSRLSGNDLQSTVVNCRNNPSCKGWMGNKNGKTFYFLYNTPDTIECIPGNDWTTYLKI